MRRRWFPALLAVIALGICLAPVGLAQSEGTQGKWSAPFPWPHVAIHMNLLPNGKVLTWEREDSTTTPARPYALATVWDPATQIFTDVSYTAINLFCAGHSLLPDGRLFITGGHIDDHVGITNTTIFDFATNSWTPGPSMNAGRWYPTNTTLANGEVLILSGTIARKTFNELPQVRRTSGALRDLTSALKKLPLYPRMHVAPNGLVYYSGPGLGTWYLNTAGTGAWTKRARGRSHCCQRSYGSSVLYDVGKVLIMGGAIPPTNTAEVIDLNAPQQGWRYTSPMHFIRRQLNATLLADGKVLVTGGTSSNAFNDVTGAVLAAEIWDPATEIWTTVASMQVPRIYHGTALLLPDARVLSSGSGKPAGAGGDVDHKDAEIYSPPYLFNPDGTPAARPQILSAPPTVTYGQSVFIGTPPTDVIQKVTWIRLGSVTHSFDMDQRFLSLAFSPTDGGLNVTTPSSPNLSPPGYYLLFTLNAAGTPSAARIVQIG